MTQLWKQGAVIHFRLFLEFARGRENNNQNGDRSPYIHPADAILSSFRCMETKDLIANTFFKRIKSNEI